VVTVQRDTPTGEVAELVRREGYAVMEDALTAEQLAEITRVYDRLLHENPPAPGAIRVELPRLFERDPVFEQFMDNPPVFAVVRELLGPTLDLATGGELDYKFGATPAYISWHADLQFLDGLAYPRQVFWVRCVYMIGDVTEDMGPFTLVPRTHLRDPEESHRHVDADGQPLPVEGQVPIVGRAGSCLINNTEIWHTNTPNTSGEARRLVMVLYKPVWMKPWDNGYDLTPEFTARQTDPVRRQLAGGCSWTEHDPGKFPVASWTPS
jgi:ectoine hydroxylase-related dioxygenase (phytanoyl-CoA dioxygenase family)